MCSTPFGINGTNRAIPKCRPRRERRAQRLSASTEQTESASSFASSPLIVLNAFRHQRNKQCHSIYSRCGSAHVLNAFRHQRNKQPLLRVVEFRCSWCAQRLSASTEQTASLLQTHSIRRQQCAQRLSASTEQTAAIGRFEVDALICAQRLSASTEQTDKLSNATAPILLLCSTPFGINGTNSQRADIFPLRLDVLNAFRHQRNKQLESGERKAQ